MWERNAFKEGFGQVVEKAGSIYVGDLGVAGLHGPMIPATTGISPVTKRKAKAR